MKSREAARKSRHQGIRKRLTGTPDRPRLAVHRSLKNIYVQVIDDTASKTLFSFSTKDAEFQKKIGKAKKTEAASQLGKFFGPRLKDKGIKKIAFDRSGLPYHGRIKAVADSLRESGIEF